MVSELDLYHYLHLSLLELLLCHLLLAGVSLSPLMFKRSNKVREYWESQWEGIEAKKSIIYEYRAKQDLLIPREHGLQHILDRCIDVTETASFHYEQMLRKWFPPIIWSIRSLYACCITDSRFLARIEDNVKLVCVVDDALDLTLEAIARTTYSSDYSKELRTAMRALMRSNMFASRVCCLHVHLNAL